MFLLSFTTIKKSYAETVFVAWPRALPWEEQKIIDLFLRRQHQNILITSAIIFFLIFFYKHHLHLPLFSLNVMAFPACTYRPAVREHHWVSARGVGFRCLGLCTLQIGNSFVFVFNHVRLSFFWKLLWMINHWRYIYSRWSVCCTESVTLKHTRTCTCNVGKCHACTTHRRHTLRRCVYFLLASPNL